MDRRNWNEIKDYCIQKEKLAQREIEDIFKVDTSGKKSQLIQHYTEASCYRHIVDMIECIELSIIKEKFT